MAVLKCSIVLPAAKEYKMYENKFKVFVSVVCKKGCFEDS